MEKEHFEVDPKEVADTLEEARLWLRKNAKQVKTIQMDPYFTKQITVTERIDKGPEGYETVSRTFSKVEEMYDYYKGLTNGSPEPTKEEPDNQVVSGA